MLKLTTNWDLPEFYRVLTKMLWYGVEIGVNKVGCTGLE